MATCGLNSMIGCVRCAAIGSRGWRMWCWSVPPLATILTQVVPAKQLIGEAGVIEFNVNGRGSVIVTDETEVHPCASVTEKDQVPALRVKVPVPI